MAQGDLRSGEVAASTTLFGGAMVMRNAAGYLVNASTATGFIGVGRADGRTDNSAGSNGDTTAVYRPGVFLYDNSAGGDPLTAADIGAICYAVDDQTVAKTDGSSTRSPAGFVDSIHINGVFVRFDKAMTRNLV